MTRSTRLETVSCDQRQQLKEAVSLVTEQDTDLVIVSEEKHRLQCHSSLLSLYSPVVARLLSGLSCCCTPPIIFLPDFQATHIRKLLTLLRCGQEITGEDVFGDITMIEKIARVLQIPVNTNDLTVGPYLDNPFGVPFQANKDLNRFNVKQERNSDETISVRQKGMEESGSEESPNTSSPRICGPEIEDEEVANGASNDHHTQCLTTWIEEDVLGDMLIKTEVDQDNPESLIRSPNVDNTNTASINREKIPDSLISIDETFQKENSSHDEMSTIPSISFSNGEHLHPSVLMGAIGDQNEEISLDLANMDIHIKIELEESQGEHGQDKLCLNDEDIMIPGNTNDEHNTVGQNNIDISENSFITEGSNEELDHSSCDIEPRNSNSSRIKRKPSAHYNRLSKFHKINNNDTEIKETHEGNGKENNADVREDIECAEEPRQNIQVLKTRRRRSKEDVMKEKKAHQNTENSSVPRNRRRGSKEDVVKEKKAHQNTENSLVLRNRRRGSKEDVVKEKKAHQNTENSPVLRNRRRGSKEDAEKVVETHHNSTVLKIKNRRRKEDTIKKNEYGTSHLSRHMKADHNGVLLCPKLDDKAYDDYKYWCSKCDFKSRYKSTFKVHHEAVHDKVKFPCSECGYEATYKSHLNSHIKSIHEGVKYPCPECNYEATDKSNLNTHVKSVHKGVKYPCSKCEYLAANKSSLIRHVKAIHKGVRYPCSECHYEATQQSSLKSHIKSIHEGVKYSCSKCEYLAARKSTLNRHVKRKHDCDSEEKK